MLFLQAKKNRGREQKESDIIIKRWDRKAESWVMPNKPVKTSFKEVLDFLKEHQVPKPNKTTERFKFSTRSRKESESLSVYLAELRRLR